MPSFKSNLDIQQNQLLDAVLHRRSDLPEHPVEGQVITMKGSTWRISGMESTGFPWGNSSGGGSGEVRQFVTTIFNPSSRSGAIIVRCMKILSLSGFDAHFSTVIQFTSI